MPNDDVSPDLSRLEKDYKILTELHREDDSRTFLARHLGLDRDVTITVSGAPGDDDKALVHFAADARLLASIRHPNLIPVIEGVWLDQHTLAVVRERTDGSTLDQLISSGPIPAARVAATIEQVQAALDRARSDGVVHRNVSPRSVVLEQGNGRLLVSLEQRPLSGDAKPDESDDARALGRLASDMLSGKIGGNDEPSSEAKTSPQVAPEIAEALEAIETCNRSSASSAVAALITALKPPAESTKGDQAAAADAKEPVAEPAIAPPSRLPGRPRRRAPEKAVVASSFGFKARLGTGVAIAAIVAAGGLFLFRQRNARDPRLALAASDTQQAAGEVAPGKRRSDSAAARGSSPPITASQPATPPGVTPSETLRTPQKPETTSTVTPPPPTSDTTSAGVPRPRIMLPDTPRHEPPKTAPPLTFPMPHDSTSTPAQKPPPDSVPPAQKSPPDSVAPAQKAPPDSVAPASGTNTCASQAAEDQQKCLTEAIDRSDRAVTAVLAKLISALRRQAGAAAADPDPPAVDQLRAAQRAWVGDRDAACRDIGEQPLYARGRSACFAAQSTNRARELQRMLDTIPPSS